MINISKSLDIEQLDNVLGRITNQYRQEVYLIMNRETMTMMSGYRKNYDSGEYPTYRGMTIAISEKFKYGEIEIR